MIRKLANSSVRSNLQTNVCFFSLKKTPFGNKGGSDRPPSSEQRPPKKFLNAKITNEPQSSETKQQKPTINETNTQTRTSIFFNEGSVQPDIKYEKQTHQFIQESMKDSILHRISKSKNDKFKGEAAAELDVMEGNYEDALNKYRKEQSDESSPNYLKALSMVNPQEALEVVKKNWIKLKKNIIFLQNILDEACKQQDDKTVEETLQMIANKQSNGSNLNMWALNHWLQPQLHGIFSQKTPKKVNLVLNAITAMTERKRSKAYPLYLSFNIKQLTIKLLNSAQYSQLSNDILTLLKKSGNFNESYVDFPKFIEFYISKHHYSAALLILGKTKSIQTINNSVQHIRSKYLEGTLLNQLFQQKLKQFYSEAIKSKNQRNLTICLKIAHAVKCDSIIFDMYHHSHTNSKLLTQAYLDAVIRIPTDNQDKLLNYIKGITSQPEPAIKSKIISGDYETAFLIFKGQILDKLLQQHQRQHVKHFLYTVYDTNDIIDDDTRVHVDKIVKSFTAQQLWQLYRQDTDYDELIKLYLPKDHHSFWEETFNKRALKKLKNIKESGKLKDHKLTEREKKVLPKLDKYIEKQNKNDHIKRDVEIYLLELEALAETAKIIEPMTLLKQLEALRKTATPEVKKILDYYGLHDFSILTEEPDDILALISKLRSNDYQNVQPLQKNVMFSAYPQAPIMNIAKFMTDKQKPQQKSQKQQPVKKSNEYTQALVRVVKHMSHVYTDSVFDDNKLMQKLAEAMNEEGYDFKEQFEDDMEQNKGREEQDKISDEEIVEYMQDLKNMGDIETMNLPEDLKEEIRDFNKERNWRAIWANMEAQLQTALEEGVNQIEDDMGEEGEEGVEEGEEGATAQEGVDEAVAQGAEEAVAQEGAEEAAAQGAEEGVAQGAEEAVAQGAQEGVVAQEGTQAVAQQGTEAVALQGDQAIQQPQQATAISSQMKVGQLVTYSQQQDAILQKALKQLPQQSFNLDNLQDFEVQPSEQQVQVDAQQLQIPQSLKQSLQKLQQQDQPQSQQSEQYPSWQSQEQVQENQIQKAGAAKKQLRHEDVFGNLINQNEITQLSSQVQNPQIFPEIYNDAQESQLEQLLEDQKDFQEEMQRDPNEPNLPYQLVNQKAFIMTQVDQDEEQLAEEILIENEGMSLGNIHFLKQLYEGIWRGSRAMVELDPIVVQPLIMWGIAHQQPMAVFMGEMVASLTKQKIKHSVAVEIGKFLSHQKQTDSKIIEKAKKALELLGPINRDNIYNFNYKYQHIQSNSDYLRYLTEMLQVDGHPLTDKIKRQMMRRPLRWQPMYQTDFSPLRYVQERASKINAP